MPTAIFSNLPINQLGEIRRGMKQMGVKIKVRYRGPRNIAVGDHRAAMNRKATCLKKNAVTFSVYPEVSYYQ